MLLSIPAFGLAWVAHSLEFSMDGNGPAGLSHCAQLDNEALRAGCPAAHVEFLRCGPRSAVLESEHEEYYAQLPDSCLSEWRAGPTARALARGQSVAVKHGTRDSLGGVSRIRTEPDRR